MRTHTSPAPATLLSLAGISLAGLALAACDRNLIGGFEGGSGGAGGGDDSVTSTPGATTSPASSGANGSDASSGGNATGGGSDPSNLPDTGEIGLFDLTTDGPINYNVYADFQRGRPIEHPLCDPVLAVGACAVYECTTAATDWDFSSKSDAGTLTVTGTSEPLSMELGSQRDYYENGSGPLFGEEPIVTVAGSGGDVPAFTTTVPRTPVFTALSPDFEEGLHTTAGEDLVVTWDPSNGGVGDIRFSFHRSGSPGSVVCNVPFADGTMTVDADLLDYGAETRAASYARIETFNMKHIAVGTYDVLVYTGDIWSESDWTVDGE